MKTRRHAESGGISHRRRSTVNGRTSARKEEEISKTYGVEEGKRGFFKCRADEIS